MSFRELRNFTEIMRTLGYPRPISMENFRTPNFELVAEILYWLVNRYDPSIEVVDEIGLEQERVAFLGSIVQAMAKKAGIRLNAKKLYGADGYAVKELLKIATVLYDAFKVGSGGKDDEAAPSGNALAARLHEVKRARQLTSEITSLGASLYDLLNLEQEQREERNRALGRPLDLSSIERSMTTSIEALQHNIEQMETRLSELGSDEGDLATRIEKRKQELERGKKRLESLQGVRPAFMDEYERLEGEMAKLYSTYLEKFRNMEFLEHQLDVLRQEEQARMQERERAMKAMQSKLKEEERLILRGELSVDEGLIDDDGGAGGRPSAGQVRRPRAVGSMRGGDDDGSGDSGSLASGSDSGEEITIGDSDDGGADEIGDLLDEDDRRRGTIRGGAALRGGVPPRGGPMMGRGMPPQMQDDSGSVGIDDESDDDGIDVDGDDDGGELDPRMTQRRGGPAPGRGRAPVQGGDTDSDLSDNEF